MNHFRFTISDLRFPKLRGAGQRCSSIGNRQSAIVNAFTLIELLVVISILGILAGLVVPALKNFGKSDAGISASRQLLDDVGRARQLAMSQRTTVYMVFVPTNFWDTASGTVNSAWWSGLNAAQQTAATNLCGDQLSGYTFIAHGALGDQPGNHQWHYLAPWQNLPDGMFIAQEKFAESSNQWYTITDPIDATKSYNIYGFATNNIIPFPTETSTNGVSLPYIAFNYLGQLTTDGVDMSGSDEYIPLAKGSVLPAMDSSTKSLLFSPPSVLEVPPGNSTNAYDIIHIDRLTGRATLEFPKIQ